MEKYLTGIRILHMRKGCFDPLIRPDVIITRGACNRDQLIKRMEGKPGGYQ